MSIAGGVSKKNRIGQVLVETYQIERLIAEGGMGSVYEAKHLRLPKRFAVKFLNLSLVNNAEALARFRREAEIIATLDHPHIVNLLDYNVTDEGVPYIVLEYLDGEHLGKRIARGKVPLAEAMRILAPVVQALSSAHVRNIVHRDLKPENIVLCKGDVVKVVDFGIAKIRGGQDLTASNVILGTVPYMAPEQLFSNSVDARTDQFALAAILYEMLGGQMAFGGPSSVPEVAMRVAHHQPPFVAEVSPPVNHVLFQAMAKDPAARFPSVEAFFQALVEAASRPDEPAVVVDFGADEGLPPLHGEATAITRPAVSIGAAAAGSERQSLGDDEAPPPAAPDPRAATTAEIERPAAPIFDGANPPPTAPPGDQLMTARLSRDELAGVPAPPVAAPVSAPTLDETSGPTSMPDEMPALRGSTTWIWAAVALVVVAVLGVGVWLAFFHRPM